MHTDGSSPEFETAIIAFGGGGGAFHCEGAGAPTLICSDIYGNEGGDWTGCVADQADSNGNFSADPLFCFPDTGNYDLDARSPCLDAPDCGVVGAHGEGCDIYTSVSEDPVSPNIAPRMLVSPNPFNPLTTIAYTVPAGGEVWLSIYDVRGRRLAVLAGSRHERGEFKASWNGKDDSGRPVTSGVYFARLEADGFKETKKMTLLR